ncbi:hypothetical protein LNO88_06610 [Klebsiella pneumoniae subsp. pneumoniae]|nr:hypothetical protein [Klebsiella pneumoniae subsp. pneumoniae]
MFISHDLHVVRWLSDRILVMYLGEVVEIGPAEQLFTASAHSLYPGAVKLDALHGPGKLHPDLAAKRRSPAPSRRRAAAASHPLPACEGGLRRGGNRGWRRSGRGTRAPA